MLKQFLLVGSMMIAGPVLAQDMAGQDSTSQQQATMAETPAQQQSPAQDTPATTQPQSQQSAAAAQVAQLVDSEWELYDTNANNALEQSEFAAWMIKLRQASDPSFTGTSEEAVAWLNGAFGFADKDESQSISKVEMITLLTPAPAEQAPAEQSADTTDAPAS